MATTGAGRRSAPADPRKTAPPRLKIPPSAATSHAPGPAPAPSPELAIEAAAPRRLVSIVVAATRPTTRRRPRWGRPMVRIWFRIHRPHVRFLPFWVKTTHSDLVWARRVPG